MYWILIIVLYILLNLYKKNETVAINFLFSLKIAIAIFIPVAQPRALSLLEKTAYAG